MNTEILTQDRMTELFSYNKDTGVFIRLITTRSNAKEGDIVGCKRNDGYLQAAIDNKSYLLHRLAWFYVYGSWPKNGIDHINGIKDDNRIVNLRDVSHQENRKNSKISKHSASGIIGVNWNKSVSKWHASIRDNGKNKFLGYFNNIEDAAKTRKEAEIKYGYHKNHGRE